MQMISFTEALELALLADDRPIVTDYDVYLRGKGLVEARTWQGAPMKNVPKEWDELRLRRSLRRLAARKALVQDHDFRSGVWRVVQSTRSGSAEEVACIADPFCYVSHLSAMERYGLSDRSPAALHLTTPTRTLWNTMRDKKLADEIAADKEAGSLLLRFGFKEKLRRRPVVVHETRHPSPPIEVRGELTRISAIGHTFADMLSEPALCGGMHHVLDVWDRHARDWVDQIIPAVDGSESKIVKVRAGHILSERLGIQSPVVSSWRAFAQRGGSRKLDPETPYEPVYSETWMISLNV